MEKGSTSPVEIGAEMEGSGYTAQFMPAGGPNIRCLTCRAEFPAGEAHSDALGRTEGTSDPDDETAVVAINCPACGAKGTMTLHYGAMATPDEADILTALD